MNAFPVDDWICHSRRENGAARDWALARKSLLALSLALACQSALAQAMYRIKPLSILGDCTSIGPIASGFNGADQVTGQACNANGDSHAFLWKNNGTPIVDLGPPEVGSMSAGTAINASGHVTGYGQDSAGEFGFVSSGDGSPMKKIPDGLGGSAIYPSAINDLGQLAGDALTAGDSLDHAFMWANNGSPMADLGTLGGDTSSVGAINASGEVAGIADVSADGRYHAFIWRNDGKPMVDLGTLGGPYSRAFFINDSGQVAGDSYLHAHDNVNHAFVWMDDGKPMRDLGTLGGTSSHPQAFNNSGQVAGYSDKLNNGGYRHAFVWMNNGTPMKDLGTLGGNGSVANDLNSSGQVTGIATLPGNSISHAFLWRNDGTKLQDLNKLIDPADPLKSHVTLTSGTFINDIGDIVAEGTDIRTGVSAPYLLQGTVLTLTPRSLVFGNQPINTKSVVKSVTMTNTSAKVVAITSIALKGTGASQFASTNNCGSSLVGHAICTIKVTFKPTTKGAKSATLNVNGGGGGLRTVTLTGTGT